MSNFHLKHQGTRTSLSKSAQQTLGWAGRTGERSASLNRSSRASSSMSSKCLFEVTSSGISATEVSERMKASLNSSAGKLVSRASRFFGPRPAIINLHRSLGEFLSLFLRQLGTALAELCRHPISFRFLRIIELLPGGLCCGPFHDRTNVLASSLLVNLQVSGLLGYKVGENTAKMAARLRAETTVTCRWIAEELVMGHWRTAANAVRRALSHRPQ